MLETRDTAVFLMVKANLVDANDIINDGKERFSQSDSGCKPWTIYDGLLQNRGNQEGY
jgi:hypothetical protein